MSSRRHLIGACAIAMLWTTSAHADPAVRVDAAAARLVHAGGTTAIPLTAIAPQSVHVEDVPVGAGKSVTHVKIAAEPHAWEALVAHDRVLFAGFTGFTRGQDGEQSGEIVQVVPRDAATRFVLVGEVRQDRTICGQEMTALAPRVVDPATMELRAASVQRLTPKQREEAQRVTAVGRGGPAPAPLARLLSASASSTGDARALTDGDDATAWTEERAGLGAGEFVTMSAAQEVPITGFAVVAARREPRPNDAAPRTFYLVTEDRTFAVTMPNDASAHPGEAYEIPLPEPVRTRCVSLVLDSAYAQGAAPDVGVAELVAYSAFDGPDGSLEKVARVLAGGGARADGAAALLKRAAGGPDAVRAVYGELDGAGRALAMDVAASAPDCAASASVLVMGLADTDAEVKRKAGQKLARCSRVAVPALIEAVKGPDLARRIVAASLLAQIAPREALAPLAGALADGDARARTATRAALSHAARAANAGDLAALLADRARPEAARIELVRALSGRLAEMADTANAAIGDLLGPSASMRTRYLLAGPLADMARAGDARATARLTDMLAHDADGAVRARAAEAAAGIASLGPALASAAEDPEPRVREAALRSIAAGHARAGVTVAIKRLGDDPWTFVRAAAAGALAALGASPDADRALAAALADRAPRVRGAAAAALGTRRAATYAPQLVERLASEEEDTDVRVAAARSLGQMCARDASDRLTKIAKAGASPVASEEERNAGLAAIDALGRIHPADLAARLKNVLPADANADAKRAADMALRRTDVCR